MIDIFTFGGKTTNIGEHIANSNDEIYQHQNIAFILGDLSEHKDYEEKAADFKFEFTAKENLFIVDPSEAASGALLVTMESVKDADNYVFCMIPDMDFLSKKQAQQTQMVAMILQEFARSGLLKEVIILSEKTIESSLEEVDALAFEEKIEEHLAALISMLWWAKNNKGIMNKLIEPIETTRITTLGSYDEDYDSINMLFDLQYTEKEALYPLEIDFYFIVSQETLKTNKNLIKHVKKIIKSKKQNQFSGANIGFKIIEGISDYTLTQIKTSKIQTI